MVSVIAGVVLVFLGGMFRSVFIPVKLVVTIALCMTWVYGQSLLLV